MSVYQRCDKERKKKRKKKKERKKKRKKRRKKKKERRAKCYWIDFSFKTNKDWTNIGYVYLCIFCDIIC